MEYTELRELLLGERNSSTLQYVPSTFYEDLNEYVEMEEDFYQMRSKRICAEEIRQIRFQKIVDSATKQRLTENYDSMPLKMTPEETKFYSDCIKLYKGWKNL